MNVFSENGFKIDYTMRMDRFSASKDNEWIKFSPTVFAVIVAIVRTKSKSRRIIVIQHGSHFEVIKVLDNFMISFTSKNLTSSLTLESDNVKCLAESYENIRREYPTIRKQDNPFRHKIKGRTNLVCR